MNVIALRGNPNNGKSETLNIVYQLMLLFGYSRAPSGPSHFRRLGNHIQKDFIDIVEKKGKKVGIATMGDYGTKPDDCVRDLLKYLDSQGCDVAICACNINVLSTVNAVVSYPNHQIIDKTMTNIPSEQRIKNGEDAEKIYKLL